MRRRSAVGKSAVPLPIFTRMMCSSLAEKRCKICIYSICKLMILRLRGRRALSDFRLAKLLQSLPALPATFSVHAEFWHFVEVVRALDAPEQARLERLLTYGPAA